MSKITFAVRAVPGGFTGIIRMPTTDGRAVKVTAPGSSKAAALSKAAGVAEKVLSNPVLSALMPPQAAIALKAAKFLAKGAVAGKLASAAAKFSGPGIRRLARLFG